jgi:hypothetical protein
MALPVKAAANRRHMLDQANTPYVRFFTADARFDQGLPKLPATDFPDGRWVYGDEPDEVTERSAIAFTFARELCPELHAPVALIDLAVRQSYSMLFAQASDRSGSPIKAHVKALGFSLDETESESSGRLQQNHSSALYNALIAPLSGLVPRGSSDAW